MDRIEKLLKEAGVETYFIRKVSRRSRELFFIKKKLDMRRVNNTADYSVTVYADGEKDGEKLRGQNVILLEDAMTDEEIAAAVKSALYAAKFALNPFFELPAPEVSEETIADSNLFGIGMDEIESAFVKAVYDEDNDERAFVNTYELFVVETKVSMKGSNGTNVSFVKREVNGEFVAQCRTPQDVETYQSFSYDSLATKEIGKLVRDTLTLTKDRASATEMPATGNYDVVISDKYMPELMVFFLDRANTAYVYQKYSNFEVGKNIQGNILGDALNIDFGVTDPYNHEGIRMINRKFIENGEVKTLHGPQRFSHYLGVEKIGTYEKVILPEGNTLASDMKKNVLHIVNFSDFQMDSMDGHFKGEIRLAYLYDEKGNVSCVTGGSVNGSIFECLGDLCFSSEMQKLSNYEGPVAIKMKNIAVSGR